MTGHIRRSRGVWRTRFVAMTAALVVVLATIAVRAVEPLTTASLSGPVTVATVDGKTIKGTIQSETPELLTVLPTPKPPPKVVTHSNSPPFGKALSGGAGADAAATSQPPAPPEPVPLEWKDVKRTSIGLTAHLALEIWKAQHAGQLCPTCRGERTVWCPTCKGTAHDPAAAANCKTCKGELLIPCKTKENKGVITCTNGCLRLGIGSWSKAKDGSVQCKFIVGGGVAPVVFGQSAIGDVIIVDFKAHTATDAGKCPICGGTTFIDDPVCHGTGKMPCPECLNRKSAGPCPDKCNAGRVVCPDCGGSGLKKT